MDNSTNSPASSPAPLSLLVRSLPTRVLLSFVKSDHECARTILQGFPVRENSLKRPLVLQRLERMLEERPELARTVYDLWREHYAPLMAAVDAPNFTTETLPRLAATYSPDALEYALLHADREEVRALATQLPAAAPPPPSPIPATIIKPAQQPQASDGQRARNAALNQQMQEITLERDQLRREVESLKRQLAEATTVQANLQERITGLEKQLAREERQARKLTQESDALRKQREVEAKLPPPMPADPAAAIEQAMALLQQSLATLKPAPRAAQKAAALAPAPAIPTPPSHTGVPGITLPKGRGKHTYPLEQITTALQRNDERLIAEVREGYAKLRPSPEREGLLLQTLAGAGIPQAILSGPLKPAVLDGSNVANMSPERTARLAIIEQSWHNAWEEGYFPVYVVVDASLRHQIDRPRELMDMVERGEIEMAPPGSSADERIIELAQQENAVILTNDRMVDWPAAKKLDKRHVEYRNGTARIGSFHHSVGWFHW